MRNLFEPDPAFPRIGFLYESDPTQGKVPELLNIDQRAGIHLDVPFTPESHEDIGRWFGRDSQSCPPRLLFQDHQMDFHLFGVSVASQGRDARYESGLGRLRADYAVEDRDGSDVEYADVETVQSEIHGLHEFMEWRLTEFDFDRPEPGETVLRVAPRSKIEIGHIEGFEVSLTPATWAGPDRPNVQAIGETTLLRTVATAPRPLQEHLLIHEAIRDLLAIVSWLPLDFTEVKVQREDAPRRAMAGNAVGRAWRPLHKPDVSRVDSTEPAVDLRFGNFLAPVNFESIGVDGLRTWLTRRDELARFTDPLLAFRFAPIVTPEVGLMQASISAEALGYTQALRAGLAPDDAAQSPSRPVCAASCLASRSTST